MLVLPRNDAFVRTFLGAVRAGLVPAPIGSPHGLGGIDVYVEGIARLAVQSGAKLLVTESRFRRLFDPVRQRAPGLTMVTPDEITGDGSFRPPQRSMDDVCFLQFTSGSTARPRGVMVTHRNLAANLEAMTRAFGDRGLALEAAGLESDSPMQIQWTRQEVLRRLRLRRDRGLPLNAAAQRERSRMYEAACCFFGSYMAAARRFGAKPRQRSWPNEDVLKELRKLARGKQALYS